MSHNNFPMVSEWMENGNANEFVKNHRDAEQFEFIGLSTTYRIFHNHLRFYKCHTLKSKSHMWHNTVDGSRIS